MKNLTEYTFESHSADETKALAQALAPALFDGACVTFCGDLGAGKTQFVQGVAAGLGIGAQVVSPTFNIVIEYAGALPLYHFDLYRLESAEELDDIDFYALVDEATPGVAFIEWSEKFPEEMPDDRLEISICVQAGGVRQIHAQCTGARSQEILTCWVAQLDC
jgi:tRNA threonylcarbamoyladenosine biosynthesis protein TsaE